MTASDLRAILSRLGMTQMQMARILDVDPKTVRRWVSRKNPTPIPRVVAIVMHAADNGQIPLTAFDVGATGSNEPLEPETAVTEDAQSGGRREHP